MSQRTEKKIGKRSQATGAKRQLILTAALAVFSQYGIHGARLEQVAERAGVSKTNLLYYYPSKEALYVAVMRQILDIWLAPLKAFRAEFSPLEAIKEYIRLKLEVSRDYPQASRLFCMEMLAGAPLLMEELTGDLKALIDEKFAPYFRPVYDVLLKRLGASFMQYCLRPEIGKVEIAPFAYMRGRTFENAVVILDEAQNVTAAQMKMFLTRLGENVTVIVNGDITQCDLPRGVRSGLSDALERFEEDEMVGIVHFNKDDCVRSALCQRTLHAYS
ncbi:phosphate starvation-inducible protein PhoH [Salmonella enterica]|nr:phosphate starvation-inducible protein PhoH [Salmonella enterica]